MGKIATRWIQNRQGEDRLAVRIVQQDGDPWERWTVQAARLLGGLLVRNRPHLWLFPPEKAELVQDTLRELYGQDGGLIRGEDPRREQSHRGPGH